MPDGPGLRIGVLAIQGGFEAHLTMLRELGAKAREVRKPADLEALDGLVIPGGESTTILMGIESAGLGEALAAHHARGGPIFGTCAGMIVCDDAHLGLIDATARRNAFGRQLQSFEADLAANAEGLGRLLAHCRDAKAVLHCSSGGVYAAPGHEAVKETDALGDNHRAMMPTYSLCKIAAEAVTQASKTDVRIVALSQSAGRIGDVAVKDGRIVAVGEVAGVGAEEIDAAGHARLRVDRTHGRRILSVRVYTNGTISETQESEDTDAAARL